MSTSPDATKVRSLCGGGFVDHQYHVDFSSTDAIEVPLSLAQTMVAENPQRYEIVTEPAAPVSKTSAPAKATVVVQDGGV